MKKIVEKLFEMQDIKYRDFNSKSIPNVDKKYIIGVRIPVIRKYAKQLYKNDCGEFLSELPHYYLEENLLHGELISLNNNYDETLELLDKFLPYIDNWEVCDLIKPKVLTKDYKKTYNFIRKCIKSKYTYKIRFGIVMLLTYYLGDEYRDDINNLILSIKSDEYYVNMAIAWYFSFALIKQYDKTIYIFENKLLDKWIHNKSIQKAIESYRVTNETKEYLRSLKIK